MLSGPRKLLDVMGLLIQKWVYDAIDLISPDSRFYNDALELENLLIEEIEPKKKNESPENPTEKEIGDNKKNISLVRVELPRFSIENEGVEVIYHTFQNATQLFMKDEFGKAFALFKKIIKSLKESKNEETRYLCAKAYFNLGLCYLTTGTQKKAALSQFITALGYIGPHQRMDQSYCLIALEIINLLSSPEFLVELNRVEKIKKLNYYYVIALKRVPNGSALKKEISQKFISENGIVTPEILGAIDDSYTLPLLKFHDKDVKLLAEFSLSLMKKKDYARFSYEEIVRIVTLFVMGNKIEILILPLEDFINRLNSLLEEVQDLLKKCNKENNPVNQKEIARRGIAWCLLLEMTKIKSVISNSNIFKAAFMQYVQNDPLSHQVPLSLPEIEKPFFFFPAELQKKEEKIGKHEIIKLEPTQEQKTLTIQKQVVMPEKIEKKSKSPPKSKSKKSRSTKEKLIHKKEPQKAAEIQCRPIHIIIAELQESINSYKKETAKILQALRELKNVSHSEPTQQKASLLSEKYLEISNQYRKKVKALEIEKNEIKPINVNDQKKLRSLNLILQKKPDIQKNKKKIHKIVDSINSISQSARDFDSRFDVIEEELDLLKEMIISIESELKQMSNLHEKYSNNLLLLESELKQTQSNIEKHSLIGATEKLNYITDDMNKINQHIEAFQTEGLLKPIVYKTCNKINLLINKYDNKLSQLKQNAVEIHKTIQAKISHMEEVQTDKFKQLQHLRDDLKKSINNIGLLVDRNTLKLNVKHCNDEIKQIVDHEKQLIIPLMEKEKKTLHLELKKANETLSAISHKMEKEEELYKILEECVGDELAYLSSSLDKLNQITIKELKDTREKAKEAVQSHISKLDYFLLEMGKYDSSLQRISIKGVKEKINLARKECEKTEKEISNFQQKESLSVLNINDDLAEIHKLTRQYPDHQIELKGGIVFLLGTYHYAKDECKIGKIDDIDLLILSDNTQELSIRLQKDGFIFNGQDSQSKYIQLRKKSHSGKWIDVTIGDRSKYEGDEFISGPASGKAILIDDNKEDNIDIQTGMGFGIVFQKDPIKNPHFKDFLAAIKHKKYFVQKYNPEKHQKYFKNIVKYSKKMIDAFGDACLKLEEKERQTDFIKDEQQTIYDNVTSGIKKHCMNELKLPPPQDRRIFLEINALIKCFGLFDDKIQIFIEALIEALVKQEPKLATPKAIKSITHMTLENIHLKYQSNPFLSDKDSSLLTSYKNIGTGAMRKDFSDAMEAALIKYISFQVPKNYSQSPLLQFNPQIHYTQFRPLSEVQVIDEKGRGRLMTPAEICNAPNIFSYHPTIGFQRVSKEQLQCWYQQNAISLLYKLYCPIVSTMRECTRIHSPTSQK